MQNEPSSSSTRRRDAAQSRLQESPQSNDERLLSEAGVPQHRSSSVRSRRQRDRGAGSPGYGESGPELHSSGQPPALEYYKNDEECVSGEDTDADEMAEEEEHYSGGEEGAPADKSNVAEGLSDVSDSEEEDEELDNSLQLQQESASKSKRAAPYDDQASSGSNTKRRSPKQPHQDPSTSSRYHQGRKRSRHAQQQEEEEELDCSSEQYVAEVKRLRESKLKHNKNEQLRRKDMKEAVHRLRNQLRRKTKKPSTISVLKAAKQEIDELTAIKAEEEKELERLRQKEFFLKYQLESLVSDHNKRLSTSGNAGVMVSPIGASVVGPTPSFLHSSPTAAVVTPTNPPPPPPPLPPALHSRPGLPHAQFSSLFPTVLPPPPAAVSRSTAAAGGVATSPTAIRRVGLIDSPQHAAAAAHASIITPTGLRRLPLPQPPSLIPFTATATANLNPSTPPSIGGGGSSTSSAARSPGTAISIFPTVSPGSAIIPGITPLQFLPPRTTTAPATAQTLYAGFPIMQYPGIGRHPLPTSPVVGAGLTATHPVVGRLPPMPPTFPLYLPTAALRGPPTTALGVARGFAGHLYSAATPTVSPSSSSTRHMQIIGAELSPRAHTNGRSRHSSGGGDRNTQTTDNSEGHHSSSAGSKNGVVSAETCSSRAHSPSRITNSTRNVREVSAESRHAAGFTSDNSIYRVMATESRDSEGHRLRATKRQRSSDGNVGDDDDSYSNSRITATVTEKRPKVFDRYSRNHGFEKNASKKHLHSTAPPLLKMIDLDTDCDTSAGEKWSEDGQQFVHERDRDQYQHHCTLPPPPALRNAISTVIKHMQPQGQIVSSSMVTGVGYGDHKKDFEHRDGLEDFRCRGGGAGEQRYRVSNSLSSSDEGPDSPLSQQKFNGSEQSMCSYNKMLGRDGIYVRKHSSLSDGVCSHKNLQYKNLRKKKNNFHRPNSYNHHTIVLQSTT